MNPQDLDDLFASARNVGPDASSALLARVLEDGLINQPKLRTLTRAAPVKPGFWALLTGAVGGGLSLAGVGTATLAGLWIGFVQPTSLTNLSDTLWQDTALDSVELIPSFDEFLTEG